MIIRTGPTPYHPYHPAELAAEIDERDIVWFVLGESALQTNHAGAIADHLHQQLRERFFNPDPGETTVLLIGKDGTANTIVANQFAVWTDSDGISHLVCNTANGNAQPLAEGVEDMQVLY